MPITQVLLTALGGGGGGGGGGSAADFTIEWWQKVENNSNNARPWSVGLYSTQVLSISYESMTSDYFWINSGFRGTAPQNHVGQGWRHLAYVRSGGVVKGYINGVQYTGDYPADQLITDTTTPLYVGTGEIAAGTYKGYITNLHIMKGVAKYLTTFSPPTVPTIPSLGSVMLLSALDDLSKYTDSVGAKVASLTGTVSWSADTPFTAIGPFTQFTNVYGNNIIDFSGGNYNGNLLNVVAGWIVSDASGVRGTATKDAYLAAPGVIRIEVDFDNTGTNTWTFTQPEFGGSLYFEGSSYLNYGGSVDWAMDVTAPTYMITPLYNNINEGTSLTVNVTGINVPDGTYYWTVSNSGDFGTSSGSFSMVSNGGTFSVTPAADVTTEGAETFTVSVRTGSTSGTVVATSSAITINDTSIAPVPPFSLAFNMSEYLVTQASADWNLGTTWTIEFWMKANAASDTAAGGIWGLLNQTGWNAVNSINVALSDNKLVFLSGSNANDDVRFTEPTAGVWTHVAITNAAGTQKVYYNGVEQTLVGGIFGSANYANSTDDLYIGRLSNQYVGYGGQFNGKLAMVRISNAVKYATTFTATTTYGVEADTKLFLSSDTPFVDGMSHTITNNGVTISTDFPT